MSPAASSSTLRRWVHDRGIGVRIARKGIESSQRLGHHRWVIERTISWLTSYHRLNLRYERKGIHFCAFLTLAATLTTGTSDDELIRVAGARMPA
ncbi:transposase [Nocardia gipuzkoensis]